MAFGLIGPTGIDPGTVRILHDGLKAVLFDPAVARVCGQVDMPAIHLDSDAYRTETRRQADDEKALVQRLGLRID